MFLIFCEISAAPVLVLLKMFAVMLYPAELLAKTSPTVPLFSTP